MKRIEKYIAIALLAWAVALPAAAQTYGLQAMPSGMSTPSSSASMSTLGSSMGASTRMGSSVGMTTMGSSTGMSSSVGSSTGIASDAAVMATAPSFSYHNSLLERHIALPSASRVTSEKGRVNSAYASTGVRSIRVASPLRKATPLTTGGGFLAGSPQKGGKLSGGSGSYPMPGPVVVGPPAGGGDNTGGTAGGGIGGGTDDRRPGELQPIGDAILPLLILALLYSLFVLIRSELREHRQS